MLKRFCSPSCCFSRQAAPPPSTTPTSGIIPAEAGWGVNVVQSDNFLFITFFIYGADGKPTWFTGQVTQDASGNFNGTLYSTTGTYYILPWAGSHRRGGRHRIVPAAGRPTRPRLIYTVNGVGTVTKTIQRQTLTAITVGGMYSGAQSGTYSGCTRLDQRPLSRFLRSASHAAHQFRASPSHLVTTRTSVALFPGRSSKTVSCTACPPPPINCSDGLNTSASMTEIKATAQGVEGRFSAPSVGRNCREDAQFSGVLR